MAARLMWGSDGDEAHTVDAEAVQRAEESASSFTLLEAGEVGDAPAGPVTEAEGGPVPADRLVYLVEDDDTSRPIAVAAERVAGNADTLAAVEEEWKALTGGADR